MTKKSNLINETVMYSVQQGNVVVHHLPYARGNPLLEIYTAKGFTYERPVETMATPAEVTLVEQAKRCLDVADERVAELLKANLPLNTPDLDRKLDKAAPKLRITKRKYRRKVK